MSSTKTLDQKSESAYLSVLEKAAERGFLVNRTKIAKLLYLADLMSIENGHPPVTTIEWSWDNHGPYDESLSSSEKNLVEHKTVVSQKYVSPKTKHDGVSLRLGDGATYETPTENDLLWIEKVVAGFGHLSSKQIELMTYKTVPMVKAQKGGVRGVRLDMKKESSPVRLLRKEVAQDAQSQKKMLGIMDDMMVFRERATATVGA